MNPLQSRKQLLLAESELNRAQLAQEWQLMRGEVHSLVNQAKTIGFIASAVASLAAGLASCRRKASAPAVEKSSWWRTLLKGLGLVSSLWSDFRTRPKS